MDIKSFLIGSDEYGDNIGGKKPMSNSMTVTSDHTVFESHDLRAERSGKTGCPRLVDLGFEGD